MNRLIHKVVLVLALLTNASAVVAQGTAPSAVVVAEQRLALVIGNGAYREAPLSNPINDARAMAAALKEAGFTVIAYQNASHRDMITAIREFGDRLKAGRGVGLFYFAGHGMQVKGRNFLIPVGERIEREDEIAAQAIDANQVLEKMDSAGNRVSLLILDACRNNPFTRSFRSTAQGLAQMSAPVGTLVAFATAPESVAADGDGANSPYTHHLLQAIKIPDLKIEDVFKRVRANVRRESNNKQVPWEQTSLEGDFYFHSKSNAAVTPQPIVAPAKPAEPLKQAAPVPLGPREDAPRNKPEQSPPPPADTVLAKADSPQQNRPPVVKAILALPSNQSVRDIAADTPEAVAAPLYSPRDQWVYRLRQGDITTESTITVKGIGDDGSIEFSNGERRSREGALIGIGGAPDALYTTIEFPIKQWESYSYETGPFTVGGINNGGRKLECSIGDFETVKVPAGQFAAWRVDCPYKYRAKTTSTANFLDRGTPFSGTLTSWYSPLVKRNVKVQVKARAGSSLQESIFELTSAALHAPR